MDQQDTDPQQNSFPGLFANVLTSDSRDKPRKFVISGHRGGFPPENTLHAFSLAKKHNLEAVELDVWLTLDNEIVVIHGGQQGEMPPITAPNTEGDDPVYVFNLSYDQVKAHFEKTKVFEENLPIVKDVYEDEDTRKKMVNVPTLGQVFDILERRVLINIEVKIPKDEQVAKLYDMERLVKVLDQKI